LSLVTNSYFSFLKWRKPVLILSEASDFGTPSADDVVPSWAVICTTFSAAVAFNSVFSLYLKYYSIRYCIYFKSLILVPPSYIWDFRNNYHRNYVTLMIWQLRTIDNVKNIYVNDKWNDIVYILLIGEGSCLRFTSTIFGVLQ